MSNSEQDFVKEILQHLRRWELMAGLLRTAHILLGLVSVACSILVASKINSLDNSYIEWLAFCAALSVGIQTGFDLGAKANKMRRAWRYVNWSYLKYRSNGSHSIDNLIDDYKKGEEMVGDVKEIVR
ncbi:MAG TPA: hypothetical protein VMZ31_03385 [Phycisphaerae bacterium]|nr:hypothetical protein [Phycisphaerae bacterium]